LCPDQSFRRFGQFSKISSDPPHLIFGEQLSRRAPPRLLLMERRRRFDGR
jgi:hypothetical protein